MAGRGRGMCPGEGLIVADITHQDSGPVEARGLDTRAAWLRSETDAASAPPAPGGLVAAEPSPARNYAALDLGTNNCRLLIARPVNGGFRVVDAFSRIVRLGEGLA